MSKSCKFLIFEENFYSAQLKTAEQYLAQLLFYPI